MSRAPSPHGLIPNCFSFFQNEIPKLRRVLGAEENFHTVLTSVAGASDRHWHFLPLNIDNVISRRQIFQKTDKSTRALNGDAAKIRAAICQTNRGIGSLPMISPNIGWKPMPLSQPGEIFFGARRVDDEKKFLIANPVNDQVVDDSAALI